MTADIFFKQSIASKPHSKVLLYIKRNSSLSSDILSLSKLTQKRFMSNATNMSPNSRPPFVVRAGIIGSSIALATPLFTLGGVIRLWNTIGTKSADGVIFKRVISVLIGGGAITLTVNYIWPFLRDYPDLLLPFALANGVASMVWHGAGELAVGLDALAGSAAASIESTVPEAAKAVLPDKWIKRLPLAGGVIGVLTALTAPILWPLLTDLCWSKDLKHLLLGGDSFTWVYDIYYSIGLSVAIPVGLLAGISLHHVLKPFVLGFGAAAGRFVAYPWYLTSLPYLAFTTTACVLYYGTARLRGGGVQIEDFLWLSRIDPLTGDTYSMNMKTKEIVSGNEKAVNSSMKLMLAKVIIHEQLVLLYF